MLTLVSPIKSLSTRPGDVIRAQVAFPVAADSQVAVPQGTYVEGTLLSGPPKHGRPGKVPVLIHFNKLIYANGYTASLDAQNTAALDLPLTVSPDPAAHAEVLADNIEPASPFSHAHTSGPSDLDFNAPLLRTPAPFQVAPPAPTLPPLPPLPGPPTGFLVGLAVVGAFTITLITLALFRAGRHGPAQDVVVLDQGYSFQMTLSSAVTIDAAKALAPAQ